MTYKADSTPDNVVINNTKFKWFALINPSMIPPQLLRNKIHILYLFIWLNYRINITKTTRTVVVVAYA